MTRLNRLIVAVPARFLALGWSLRGRGALRRGRPVEAIEHFERALRWRPTAFRTLISLACAHARARDHYNAHRALVAAQEAHPARFYRVAPRLLAREGLDLAHLARVAHVGTLTDAVLGAPREAREHSNAQDGKRVERAGADAGGAEAPTPSVSVSERTTRDPITSASLPFGDCRDVDEYARFGAMPPISRGEIEALDWDEVLRDLLEP